MSNNCHFALWNESFLLFEINILLWICICYFSVYLVWACTEYWSLGSIALGDITCSSGQTYVKFVKVSGAEHASDETFEVYSGPTLLYTGSGFSNNETRIIEQCLTSSLNNQYVIKILSPFGNAWSSGSYITIYGKYGNAVFKSFLIRYESEICFFSLYYGIEQDATWKMTSGSASSGWMDYSFSDSTWVNVVLGSDSIPAISGTQYFRK